MWFKRLSPWGLAISLLMAACDGSRDHENVLISDETERSPVGFWRAVLFSPGGDLPFTLRIDEGAEGLIAVVRNGEEEAPFSAVEMNGSRLVLRFGWYDSEITADLAEDGGSMSGTWRKTVPGGDSTLPFSARRGDERRFLPAAAVAEDTGMSTVSGHWAAEFRDEDGSEVARGEFLQDGIDVVGTFLTPTGDYRYLAGTFEHGLLRLSTFDGAHAFLFRALAQADGTLKGDFWSRDTYHATWTARRVEPAEQVIPDGWAAVGLTNDEGFFEFRFPDLDGELISLDDPRFEGKAVLINIFGSWCPNCNDEAPLLAEWYQRYRDRGLEIVGLAYEFSGEPTRDRAVLRRFAERHGIEYPLLLAGTSDKAEAAETLPDLTAVLSYPTSIFIGRDGRVRKIHSGFSGPGTGAHHQKLVAEFEGQIEMLLAEST